MDQYFICLEFMLQLCYAIILPQATTNKNLIIKNMTANLQKLTGV